MILVNLTLLNTPVKASRWRFNTTFLKNTDYCTYFRSELDKFISENVGTAVDPCVFWYALKGCIRNITIYFASYLNKAWLCKIDELESMHAELEKQHESRKQKIQVTHLELNSLLRHRAEFLIHKTRRNDYFNGPRPRHLLAQRLRRDDKFSTISTIKSSHSHSTISKLKEINSELRTFYSKLYSSENTLDKTRCESFLQNLNLPSLNQEESEQLQTPISLGELKNATQSMKKGKSPGWDGISPEFYLVFWDRLGHFMLQVKTSSIEKGFFDRDANSAILTVLLKPNKDPTLCSSYRPLSILCQTSSCA